ncbi:unnamed protein product [Pylaiella littoralis]
MFFAAMNGILFPPSVTTVLLPSTFAILYPLSAFLDTDFVVCTSFFFNRERIWTSCCCFLAPPNGIRMRYRANDWYSLARKGQSRSPTRIRRVFHRGSSSQWSYTQQRIDNTLLNSNPRPRTPRHEARGPFAMTPTPFET